MPEDFNIGIKKLAITFARVVDGKFEPITGLNNSTIRFIRADTGAVVPYDNWEEVGNGLYQFWNFQIPEITFTSGGADYPGHLNLKVQYYTGSAWITKAETFSVYRNASQHDGQDDYPPSRAFVENRVDRQGDTIFNIIGYDNSVTLTAIESNINARSLIHKNYADNRYVTGTAGDYVTVNTHQSVTGQKTMKNLIVDVGDNDITNAKFIIRQASSPPNGGIDGLKVGYRNTNKMLFDFNSGSNASEVLVEDLKIKTTAAKYIAGNPAQNDYVWKKWVTDNFQPIGSAIQYNTIIVDSMQPSNVSGKIYNTINGAITDISTLMTLSSSNRVTLLIRQHKADGYTENIVLPDWINLIGEGLVNIVGSFARTASFETGITAKIENLNFNDETSSIANYDFQRVYVNNCIVRTTGTIDIEKSKCINTGFFGNTVTSSDNNRIANCYGNKNITWQTNDQVYSYNHITSGDF